MTEFWVFAKALGDEFSYFDNGRDALLRDVEAKTRTIRRNISSRNEAIEEIREAVRKLEGEVSRSDTELSNISQNLRYREAQKLIKELQAQFSAIDLDEAHRAKSQYDERWTSAEKERGRQTTMVSFPRPTNLISRLILTASLRTARSDARRDLADAGDRQTFAT